MKSISKFKFIAALGLSFALFSNEGCNNNEEVLNDDLINGSELIDYTYGTCDIEFDQLRPGLWLNQEIEDNYSYFFLPESPVYLQNVKKYINNGTVFYTFLSTMNSYGTLPNSYFTRYDLYDCNGNEIADFSSLEMLSETYPDFVNTIQNTSGQVIWNR